VGSKSRGFVGWWQSEVEDAIRVLQSRVGSASTREANIRQQSVRHRRRSRHYVCNQPVPRFFRAFLPCHHSHISCSKTFLPTFFFNAKPSLLFAEITRHVKGRWNQSTMTTARSLTLSCLEYMPASSKELIKPQFTLKSVNVHGDPRVLNHALFR